MCKSLKQWFFNTSLNLEQRNNSASQIRYLTCVDKVEHHEQLTNKTSAVIMNQSSMRCMFQLNTQHSQPPLETMCTLRLKYITQFRNNNELSMGQHKYFLFW